MTEAEQQVEGWRRLLLDHVECPRGRRLADGEPAEVKLADAARGDEVSLKLEVGADGVIGRVAWRASGSAILRASLSLLAECCEGRSLGDAGALAVAFRERLTGVSSEEPGAEDLAWRGLGDLEALRGVRQFPARVNCAMLPWRALLAALADRGCGDPAAAK